MRELSHILEDAGPVAVIYDENAAKVVDPLAEKFGIEHRIMVGSENGRRLDSWRNDPSAVLPRRLPDPGDLATLQYTGGTTGLPKGVNITHGQLAVNISQRESIWPLQTDDENILCVMPLFHVFASAVALHPAVYCRGRMTIHRQYHPADVLRSIAEDRITRLPVGPTIFHGLMTFDGFAETDFSSLRTALSGSAPLPEETLRQWEEITGCPILEGYGQSEGGPLLTGNTEGVQIKPGSVGHPVPETEIEIVDVETGEQVLAIGEQGEIRARGPQIMSGYRNRPAETAEIFMPYPGSRKRESFVKSESAESRRASRGGLDASPTPKRATRSSYPLVSSILPALAARRNRAGATCRLKVGQLH